MFNYVYFSHFHLVFCPPLTDPTNGQITCSVGDDGALSYEDTCTTVCNTGYEVQSGNAMRTCQSNGMWSGTDSQCSRGTVAYNLLFKSQLRHVISFLFITN